VNEETERGALEVMKMTLVRWDPAGEVDSLQSEVNRLFDTFFANGRGGGPGTRRWVPAMDLAETEDELVLTADLPGMSEDDIAIEVKDGVLTISGERRDSRKEEGKGYHRVERSFGRFARNLSLPDGIDADRVAANFDRGVLEVRIPKPEERKPHRVRIGGGAVEAGATEK
jgi:HSP20 family protein